MMNNIIKANEFYIRALTYEPNHEGALINSHRTARIVEELDRIMLRHMDEKRNTLSMIPDNNVALIHAKKAYFHHIYHTVGIEGDTTQKEFSLKIYPENHGSRGTTWYLKNFMRVSLIIMRVSLINIYHNKKINIYHKKI